MPAQHLYLQVVPPKGVEDQGVLRVSPYLLQVPRIYLLQVEAQTHQSGKLQGLEVDFPVRPVL